MSLPLYHTTGSFVICFYILLHSFRFVSFPSISVLCISSALRMLHGMACCSFFINRSNVCFSWRLTLRIYSVVNSQLSQNGRQPFRWTPPYRARTAPSVGHSFYSQNRNIARCICCFNSHSHFRILMEYIFFPRVHVCFSSLLLLLNVDDGFFFLYI